MKTADHEHREQLRVSWLAVTSAVLGVACLPLPWIAIVLGSPSLELLVVLGPVAAAAGGVALATTGRKRKRGRWLAVFGLVAGLVDMAFLALPVIVGH